MNSDGDRVAIGAVGNDGNGSGSGHVRVYEYSGGSWSQLGSDIDGEAASDQSGNSVSLNSDGDRVAIGARYNDGTGSSAGHAASTPGMEAAGISLALTLTAKLQMIALVTFCVPGFRWGSELLSEHDRK